VVTYQLQVERAAQGKFAGQRQGNWRVTGERTLQQDAFEKCSAHSPLRAAARRLF